MKTRSIGTSTSLFLFGAAIILLIGAFARFDSSGGMANLSAVTVPPAGPSLEPGDATEAAGGPALPATLSPGLDEIIKLAQAHVGDDVILAFVQNSGRTYNPTSQELLYLTDLGLSQKVLAALYSNAGAPQPSRTAAVTMPPSPSVDFGLTPPSEELAARTAGPPDDPALPPPPAADATLSQPAPGAPIALDSEPLQDPAASYFFNDLAPYGSWIDLGQQGWFWQPTVVTTVMGWQPYRDRGGWAYTESGWYWHSDYSWAWAAFHYGRWLNNPRYGWVWRPGNIWAPAWVAWRNTSEHAGWAPLPPGAPLNLGGRSPAAYGLTASSFTFVPFEYFLKPRLGYIAESPNDVAGLFRASTAANNYTVSSGKIFNLGVTTSQISAATHRPVRQFALQDVSNAGSANQSFGRGVLAVYRPVVSEKTGANNGDSRLAQLDIPEDAVPVREIPPADAPRRADSGFELPRPSTPPPMPPGMHPFSLSPGAKQSVFPPGHFAGRFSPADFDHPPRAGEPFGSHGSEPATSRPAPYDERPARNYDHAEERPSPDRAPVPESRVAAPAAPASAASTSKKSVSR